MHSQPGNTERTAIEMLVQDHRRVQTLFADFEEVDREQEDALRELVETACLELQIHSMLEEEIFYPAVRAQTAAAQDLEDLLNAAEVEHESVDDLIAKLHQLDADDPMYYAYFTVLAAYVSHHIDEEELKLFPLITQLDGLDLKTLGEEMRLRREELFAEMERIEDDDAEPDESAVAPDDSVPEAEDELDDEHEPRDISRTRH